MGFGFVVRGSSPVYIQTIDPKGPAATAGLKVGGAITQSSPLQVPFRSFCFFAFLSLLTCFLSTSYCLRGTVASLLAHLTPDQMVWVQALDIVFSGKTLYFHSATIHPGV